MQGKLSASGRCISVSGLSTDTLRQEPLTLNIQLLFLVKPEPITPFTHQKPIQSNFLFPYSNPNTPFLQLPHYHINLQAFCQGY